MHIKQKLLFLLLLTSISNSVYAVEPRERLKANLPHTDIFLFDLNLGSEKASITNPSNVTNRQGYDNQPFFTPDSKSFIYSRGDEYQTDAYEYDLTTKESRPVTASDATEFSPTPVYNNSALLFVSDRNGSVWQAQRDEPNNPTWLLASSDNREPIGYFALNQDTKDFLYWSRYGFSLALTNLTDGSYHFVSGDTPPSTPYVIPNTNLFSFVHRQMNEQVWIKSLDPKTKAITPLAAVTGNNYNYTWAPNKTILMIQNGVLYQVNPFAENKWVEVANMAGFGITNANRLAVSPNGKMLAVVGIEMRTE